MNFKGNAGMTNKDQVNSGLPEEDEEYNFSEHAKRKLSSFTVFSGVTNMSIDY